MTDKERKTLEDAGLYLRPNCVDYNQKVQAIAKEMADRIWKAINDKVQVVRCKDCKNYVRHDHRCGRMNHGFKDDFFCAWGERRKDEQS